MAAIAITEVITTFATTFAEAIFSLQRSEELQFFEEWQIRSTYTEQGLN